MLTFVRTSLFSSGAQTLVNTVNCVGVMGKGLAAEFKLRYPEMFSRYRDICESQLLDIGKLWLWKGPGQWVLNFPTKKHWRQPSRLEYIDAGLRKFVASFEERGITEVAFPRLGCGNGGLQWGEVRPVMERYLKPLPIQVYIHDFSSHLVVPEHEEAVSIGGSRSFPAFWSDLDEMLRLGAEFTTFGQQAPFVAALVDETLQLYRGAGKRVDFSKDELFDVWTALSRGITTRSKLIGKAYDEAYYLFPILARLPYVSPLRVEKAGHAEAIGLRMIDRERGSSTVASSGQIT